LTPIAISPPNTTRPSATIRLRWQKERGREGLAASPTRGSRSRRSRRDDHIRKGGGVKGGGINVSDCSGEHWDHLATDGVGGGGIHRTCPFGRRWEGGNAYHARKKIGHGYSALGRHSRGRKRNICFSSFWGGGEKKGESSSSWT